MRRMVQLIRVRPEAVARYREVHEAVWPDVLAMIETCGMHNYSIFLREPENLLIAYFEYSGTDWAADSARMAADPRTREWWQVTDPLQQPLDSAGDGQWWAGADEVFHTD